MGGTPKTCNARTQRQESRQVAIAVCLTIGSFESAHKVVLTAIPLVLRSLAPPTVYKTLLGPKIQFEIRSSVASKTEIQKNRKIHRISR